LILLIAAALGAGQVFSCVPAQVWDGDTFTCADGTKVQVAAIAAREVKCVKGRMSDRGCSVGQPLGASTSPVVNNRSDARSAD
jgi:endonuclease YncB( thermonuclease family)